jgi:hypothetical protein
MHRSKVKGKLPVLSNTHEHSFTRVVNVTSTCAFEISKFKLRNYIDQELADSLDYFGIDIYPFDNNNHGNPCYNTGSAAGDTTRDRYNWASACTKGKPLIIAEAGWVHDIDMTAAPSGCGSRGSEIDPNA